MRCAAALRRPDGDATTSAGQGCAATPNGRPPLHHQETNMVDKVTKAAADWRAQLTPEQYQVTRKKGTERAFSGKYWDNHAEGTYRCVCCGMPLFDAKTKFESGTGWPSFYEPIDPQHVKNVDDRSLFMRRTE